MGSKGDLDKLGMAQAAVLAVMIGCLTLALVNLGCEISEGFKTGVHTVGKRFIPGAGGIGPYSGKEVIALGAWLISWWILDQVLTQREWNHRAVLVIFLAGMAISTTLLWPPVFTALSHHGS